MSRTARMRLAAADAPLTGVPATARLVLRLLERLAYGTLTVVLPNGQTRHFGHGRPHAEVRLKDWSVFERALKGGDIGFAESFMDDSWHTSDLSTLLSIMVANRDALEAVIYGRWWARALARLRHALRRNTQTGSRRNIQAHYDLGNDFYALWLDPGMTYSSALFGEQQGDDAVQLEAAQAAKYGAILEALPEKGTILEVGCGWGGFATQAVEAGHRVVAVTLSREQLDFAKARLAGSDACEFRLQDYRQVAETFDAVVSIEMFEAVGEAYWPVYFKTIAKTLKAGGRAVIQTITIDERLFEAYRQGSDFIQQYIFPGGMLPTAKRFVSEAAKAGLVVTAQRRFGVDYARTLKVWLDRFMAREAEVRSQGFDRRFVRMWAFYLAYCEAAFRHGNTDVIQFTLEHGTADPAREEQFPT